MNDTIYARATAAGRAAIAVIRLSGSQAGEALVALSGSLPEPRKAVVRKLRSPDGELIDEALTLWMPGPASFTGEDCVELHVHGGPVITQELFDAFSALGLRSAKAGEFTRRGFANGKLDLLQAEAIADLVDAETRTQKAQALAQMAGRVGRRYESWRGQLIEALALIEAENDFPDEDLPGALSAQARPLILAVEADLQLALADGDRGRSIREGYRIALIGRPNAGKSSLFNALVGRDAAIVSPREGTTRDIVEADVQIAGYAVTLADTAGLRFSDDEIEAEGVRRARRWAEAANWRLLLVPPDEVEVSEEQAPLLKPGDLLVLTKSDQAGRSDPRKLLEFARLRGLTSVGTSVLGVDGMTNIREAMSTHIVAELSGADTPATTRMRHVHAVQQARTALAQGLSVLEREPEKAADDIQVAISALRSVVGDVDREAVLDQVFSSFCIGK